MEFSITIAQIEVSNLHAKFRKGNFSSLVLDKETDVYRLEQCIAYIQFSEGRIFYQVSRYPENVKSNDVIDNDDHDDRLGEHESAIDLDTNNEANETINKAPTPKTHFDTVFQI